jgi:hypothetical protein
MALLNLNAGVPRPGPDGMVFHVVPLTGVELKKLARLITKIDYIKDRKGNYVFNQAGNAVPQFDVDEDATVAKALEKCPRIDKVMGSVTDEEGAIIGETLLIDAMAKERGLHDGTVVDPIIIVRVLSLLCEVEREADPPAAPPATADGKPAADADQEKPKPQKAQMMVAEWLLGEAADIAQTRVKVQRKNS